MRFDWYAATVQAHPLDLIEGLREHLGGQARTARGMHGYTQGFDLVREDGEILAKVLAGGRNGDPHAWASGEATEAFVGAIRSRWQGQHGVTRFDAAEDFQAPGTYDLLREVVRGVALAKGVKGREIVPEDPTEGRTFYEGAPTSDVRLRLYEKGKQLRARLPDDQRGLVSPDWVRLEVQVRPKKLTRKVAAYAEPVHVWGWSEWTQTVAERVLQVDVPRVKNNPWRESDDDRAFRFMIQQYGPLLGRMVQDLGSWCVLGKTIGEAVEEAQARRRK